jgi:hypothetical protein
MKATEVLKNALASTQSVLATYLSDLSDADLLVRPVPEANHLAWQLGHLINAEVMLGSPLPGVKYPSLPAGFGEKHTKETSKQTDTKGYLTKAGYLDLFSRVRAATIEAVATMSDADLDKPYTGPVSKFAPTLGALVVLVANHTLMHGGQAVVLRRKLGKPILM